MAPMIIPGHDRDALDECIDGPAECAGPVTQWWPGYGNRTWPRCDHHGNARLDAEHDRDTRLGSADSRTPPHGFSEADAGETWLADDWFADEAC